LNYYTAVLSNYAGFEGRARRAEFWMFALINTIISVVLQVIDAVVGTGGILGGLYGLAVLIPSIAVGTRRLHDTNRSGWWQLIGITIIGLIPLFIWYIQDSDAGSNKYGANPKGE
jgi:uncharacterized membrane protein YhaH (DUF805 family)